MYINSSSGQWSKRTSVFVQVQGFLPERLQGSHHNAAPVFWISFAQGGTGELWGDLSGYDAVYQAAGAQEECSVCTLEVLRSLLLEAGGTPQSVKDHIASIRDHTNRRAAGYLEAPSQAALKLALSKLQVRAAVAVSIGVPPLDLFKDVVF